VFLVTIRRGASMRSRNAMLPNQDHSCMATAKMVMTL
jgi:hypothetical protein